MSLLRMKELRESSDEDLLKKIADTEGDLLRERGIAAMGGAPPSPGRLRALRTNVARALTVQTERARAAAAAAPKVPRAPQVRKAPAAKPAAKAAAPGAPKASPPAAKPRAPAAKSATPTKASAPAKSPAQAP